MFDKMIAVRLGRESAADVNEVKRQAVDLTSTGYLLSHSKSDLAEQRRKIQEKASDTITSLSIGGRFTAVAPYKFIWGAAPTYGTKPSISFSVTALMGSNAYDATLKIKNLNIPVDPSSWQTMIVVLFYGDEPTTSRMFTLDIFNSYQESPNPDGATVFRAFTVGGDFVDVKRDVSFQFPEDSCTVTELVDTCCAAAGVTSYSTQFVDSANKDFGKDKISTVKQTVTATSGWAVLNWLQSRLDALCMYLHKQHVYLVLDGGEAKLIRQGCNTKVSVNAAVVPDIDNIIRISAVDKENVLHVVAPFDPKVKPGDLVHVAPKYLEGLSVPNVIEKVAEVRANLEKLKDVAAQCKNVFQVILQNIRFSTDGPENEMELTLVAAMKSEDTGKQEDLADTIVEYHKQMDESGTILPAPQPYDESGSWIDDAMKVPPGSDYVIQPGDTLTVLAETKLLSGEVNPPQRSELSDKQKEDLKTLHYLKDNVKDLPKIRKSWFFPVIVAATYHANSIVGKAKDMHYMNFGIADTDQLTAGMLLSVPTLSDPLHECTAYKDLFLHVAEEYEKGAVSYSGPDGCAAVTQWLKTIYVLLGGSL